MRLLTEIPVPKYKIGERVYFAGYDTGPHRIQCPDCLGTKVWSVETPSKDKFEVECGTCKKGYFPTGKVDSYECKPDVKTYTIGSIQIDTGARDENEVVRYMCTETGVGSGSVYNENKLYDNFDEAYTTAISLANEYIKLQEDRHREQKYDSRGRLRKPTTEQRRIRTLEKELKKLDKNSPLLHDFSEE